MKLYATNAVVQYVMTQNIYNIYATGVTTTAKNTEKCAAKPKPSIDKTTKKKSLKQYKKEYYLRKKQEKDKN